MTMVNLTPILMGDPAVRRARPPTAEEQAEARKSDRMSAGWWPTRKTPVGAVRPHKVAQRRARLAEGIEAARKFRDRMRAQFSNEAEA